MRIICSKGLKFFVHGLIQTPQNIIPEFFVGACLESLQRNVFGLFPIAVAERSNICR